jgi:hypothetical protein
MARRLLTAISLSFALGVATAQGTGAWQVESDLDLYSYLGLGSIRVAAYQAPGDLDPDDALLVIGCDASAPLGFEVSAWVAPAGAFEFGSERIDVSVLVRFDQGPVLDQTWFLAEGFFVSEAIAYFGLNETLFAGLATATNLALRVQADPAAGIQERTFQYDVSGFSEALAALRCGTPNPTSGPAADPFGDAAPATDPTGNGSADPDPFGDAVAEDDGDGLVIGAWAFDGLDGMVAAGDLGVLAVYCAPDAANGVEIEVGDYALASPAYHVVFRSGSIDFLETTATRNQFGAAQLDGDDVENRLVRFLRGVIDVTVTLTPRSDAGPAMTYRVPTDGFNAALAALGCYVGDR